MPQLSKTAVLILMSSSAVVACSPSIGSEGQWAEAVAERMYYTKFFVVAAAILLAFNASVILFASKRYVTGVVAGLAAIPIQLLLVVAAMAFGDSCFDLAHKLVRIEVVFLSVLLLAQVGILIATRRTARLI